MPSLQNVGAQRPNTHAGLELNIKNLNPDRQHEGRGVGCPLDIHLTTPAIHRAIERPRDILIDVLPPPTALVLSPGTTTPTVEGLTRIRSVAQHQETFPAAPRLFLTQPAGRLRREGHRYPQDHEAEALQADPSIESYETPLPSAMEEVDLRGVVATGIATLIDGTDRSRPVHVLRGEILETRVILETLRHAN